LSISIQPGAHGKSVLSSFDRIICSHNKQPILATPLQAGVSGQWCSEIFFRYLKIWHRIWSGIRVRTNETEASKGFGPIIHFIKREQ
jgi:hypothetical protein